VAQGLKRIVENEPRLKLILADMGGEFYNRHVTRDILKPNNIKLYSTFSNQKAAQAERYIRYLRQRLERYFIHTNSKKWIDVLESFERVFNNTKHSRTLIEPNKVNETNEMEVVARLFPNVKRSPAKFSIGQQVRILKSVNLFSKLSDSQFSDEIFEIYKINHGSPTTYHIKSLDGEPVLGTIYFEELSPVSKKPLITKVKILGYKLRNHKRYINIETSINSKPTWESVINFNKKMREGVYEKI
jgi:hypothetical protein